MTWTSKGMMIADQSRRQQLHATDVVSASCAALESSLHASTAAGLVRIRSTLASTMLQTGVLFPLSLVRALPQTIADDVSGLKQLSANMRPRRINLASNRAP